MWMSFRYILQRKNMRYLHIATILELRHAAMSKLSFRRSIWPDPQEVPTLSASSSPIFQGKMHTMPSQQLLRYFTKIMCAVPRNFGVQSDIRQMCMMVWWYNNIQLFIKWKSKEYWVLLTFSIEK